MNKGGYVRQNKHRFCAIAAIIIVVAVQPFVARAFQSTSATETVSYSFISMDTPNTAGELGFTSLDDINDGGEIVGGFVDSSGFSFLIDRTFNSTDIRCPDTANHRPNAAPKSINAHGEIAG